MCHWICFWNTSARQKDILGQTGGGDEKTNGYNRTVLTGPTLRFSVDRFHFITKLCRNLLRETIIILITYGYSSPLIITAYISNEIKSLQQGKVKHQNFNV